MTALALLVPFSARAQDEEPPKYEFRGVWVATVLRLDWPLATAPATQQAELIDLFDKLKAAGINAVLFQVRSESDAMYASSLEPWSFWLTNNTQGTPPEPFYDPLAFAIEEAHKRGMELHAWFNPYRADRDQNDNYTKPANHVTRTHPEWVMTIGGITVLDPGLPEVRDHITNVIVDVVRRYDVDGVHFDDYFYPYPPNQITNQDDATFAAHSRGFVNRGDWRRDNVNLFVEQVYDSLQVAAPDVVLGISPFGIWKNGVPSGIVGLDAYNTIYADATAWLQAGTIDYLTPQLYWAFGGGQDYAKLAPWWASQRNGRHLYPGHGLYRSDPNTFSNTLFSSSEIPRQVRFNRDHEGIQGSVFFRALNITRFSSKGFADTLETDLFRYPALTPPMAWKDLSLPPTPTDLTIAQTAAEEVMLSWDAVEATDFEAEARFYAVYRVRAAAPPDFGEAMEDARNLLAVTGETTLVDRPGIADDPYYYAVTAVSANSIESLPSGPVSIEGVATDVDAPVRPTVFTLDANHPNPFSARTEIAFALREDAVVQLTVYDVLGRKVATLLDRRLPAGPHTAVWDGTAADEAPLPSGTYFYVLEAGGRRAARPMVLVR